LGVFSLLSTTFNSANSDNLNLNIAGFNGKILLPHFEKESQPPLEKMSNSTYPPDYPPAFGLWPLCHQGEERLCALEFWDILNNDGAN
jgi:hypothetical protein